MPLLSPRELSRLLVDTATVYGANPASDTDAYDIQLMQFACRLSGRSQATLGTGIGALRTSYYHIMFAPDVALPAGYWEVEIGGVRYLPIANSSSLFRDPEGNVVWRGLDLDQVAPSLH